MLNSIQPTVRECAHSYWPSGLAAYVCCCARPASRTRERGLSGGGLPWCSAGREQSLSFTEFKACKGCPFLRTHEVWKFVEKANMSVASRADVGSAMLM